MKNNKGFTLIELLAVIVILAIIALIATPLVLNVINEAKLGSFKASSYGIIKAAENGYSRSMLKEPEVEATEYVYDNHKEIKNIGNIEINYKGNKPAYGSLKINIKGEIEISFYENGWCATKGYETEEVNIRKVTKQEACVPDVIAPVIILIGEETITLTTDDTEFNDLGANATDNIDGDITNKIEVTHNIEIGQEGEYEVTYKVTDNAGNITVIKRKVIIEKKLTVVQVSAGYRFSLFLMSDGTVRATGDNSNGQLGDGTKDNRNSPVMIDGLNNIIQIAAGKLNHSLFLTKDYTVKAVGSNGNGQLADNTTIQKLLPIDIPNLTNVKAISIGSQYSMFLMEDGTVKVAGVNSYGQLGDGTTTYKKVPTLLSSLTNVKEVIAGSDHTAFLMNDGTVKIVGKNDIGQLGDNTQVDKATPIAISGLNNVKEIAAGSRHTIFLMSDGTVKATGNNSFGQLGDGTTTFKKIPTLIPGLTNVKTISAGSQCSMFLMEDGTVKVIGQKNSGQLGVPGNNNPILTPTTIPDLVGVKQISGGDNHTLFLMEDGTVKATGDNYYGQLGDGTNERRLTPIDVIFE